MIHQYLKRLNIDELKPMQVEAINTIKPGSQTILISPTGSGKTLAFLLPAVSFINADIKGVQVLILVPTRELGLQIEKVFRNMQTGIKVSTFYGGHPFQTERNSLIDPPSILIGTPGRIADHIRRETFETRTIKTVVLDEFDKSLELGFADEMRTILKSCSFIITRILTSATKIAEIPDFVNLVNPVEINFSDKAEETNLDIKYVKTGDNDKLELLIQLLKFLGADSSIIFCNHRDAVDRISDLLKHDNVTHGIYHGGLEQEQREISLIKFRNGTHHILLTTDLASRGLDITEVKNIIHYQLPTTAVSWLHRNGRTARMGKAGKIWVLLKAGDTLPPFISEATEEFSIPETEHFADNPAFDTIYIGAGKKDKISKGDIAGFLMKQGMLAKEQIGQIDVLDYASFVAVKKEELKTLFSRIKGIKLKNKMIKIEKAKG
ncbi:MAG: DEAD/DEAH box helicase [Chloroflexota bacterium]